MRGLTTRSLIAASALALTFGACGGDDDGGSNADAASSIDSAGSIDSAPPAPDARPPLPDAAPPVDAKPSNLACLGATLPTTAPSTVTLSGTTQTISLSGLSPVAGASITAHLVSDDSTVSGPVTSDNSGNYTMSASTGDVPLDGYLVATHPSYFDSWVYPPVPVSQDFTGAATLLVNQSQINILNTVFGAGQETDKGIVGVVVLDCDGNPIEGATVTTNPAGTKILYNGGNGQPDGTLTATGPDGVAQVYNVPVGTVTVSATASGMALRAHDVKTAAMRLTSTAMVP